MGEYATPILHNGVGSPQSVNASSITRYHTIGTRGVLQDGRVYYYARNGTAAELSAGKLYSRVNGVANHQNLATTTTSLAVGSDIATGITLGATAAAAGLYRDGYLAVTDGGAQGSYYKIVSHDDIASAGTGSFLLDSPIAVVSDANTTVSLIRNAYDDPQISVTDQQDVVLGVPNFTIPIGSTTTQYGWIQTWGECPVLCDESVAAFGQCIVPGSSTAGSVEEDDTATTVSQEPIVGYNVTALVDTEYQVIDLRIRS